jgi:hypothetical protein
LTVFDSQVPVLLLEVAMCQVEAARDFNLRDVFDSILSRIYEGSLVAIEDHL